MPAATPLPARPSIPAPKWIDGRYNSSSLTLAGGLITANVNWAPVNRGDAPGYKYSFANRTSKKTYPTMQEAQVACVLSLRKLLDVASTELDELPAPR